MLRIMFLLTILFPALGTAKSIEVLPGHPTWVPVVTNTEWLTYNLTENRLSGTLKITFQLEWGVVFSAGYVTMSNAGDTVNGAPAGRVGLFGSTNAPTSMSCTAADGGDFLKCLARNSGGTFTQTVNVSFDYIDRQKPACIDYYLFPTNGTGGASNGFKSMSNTCTPGGPGYVPDPEPESIGSVCSLNSQNLNLNYSSSGLNVDGLRQSTNLTVTCTTGTPQNYQLKLTGSNTSQGRLNFGNGVSAQVSLNGTQVAANGTGISLNGLTSQMLPVSASLVGTASGPGVTNANGVLVLEAL